MSYTSKTLAHIIDRSFDGRQASLAEAAGIPSSAMTKLCRARRSLTPSTLAKLVDAMPPDDARALCASACRDLLPQHLADSIQLDAPGRVQEQPPAYIPGPPLDPVSEAILHKIRHLVASETETQQWLHRIGAWIGITPQDPAALTDPDRAAVRSASRRLEGNKHKASPPPDRS